MNYIAIKIDVVRSRRVSDRQQLQDAIFSAVERANDDYADKLASRFAVTHGDEVQGLLPVASSTACLTLCEQFIDALQPESIRIGLGVGRLATKVQPSAIGMDGAAWHRAQHAIEHARRRRSTFFLEGPDIPLATVDRRSVEGATAGRSVDDRVVNDLNAIIDYLFSHRLQWTDNQRQAVNLLHTLGSRQAVSEHLRISAAAVSQRLSGCMWDKYERLRQTARRQLGTYIAAL